MSFMRLKLVLLKALGFYSFVISKLLDQRQQLHLIAIKKQELTSGHVLFYFYRIFSFIARSITLLRVRREQNDVEAWEPDYFFLLI